MFGENDFGGAFGVGSGRFGSRGIGRFVVTVIRDFHAGNLGDENVVENNGVQKRRSDGANNDGSGCCWFKATRLSRMFGTQTVGGRKSRQP